MKVEKRYYNIKCDCCGQLLDPDSYWDDGLEEMAEECSWKALEPDKHYCPDCYEWDDEDHLVTKDGKKWDEAGYEITDEQTEHELHELNEFIRNYDKEERNKSNDRKYDVRHSM